MKTLGSAPFPLRKYLSVIFFVCLFFSCKLNAGGLSDEQASFINQNYAAINTALQGQNPFDAKELNNLIDILPEFLDLQGGANISTKQSSLIGDKEIQKEIIDLLSKNGWKPNRFFEVLSRVGTGLTLSEANRIDDVIVEQKQEVMSNPFFTDVEKNKILSQAKNIGSQMKAVKSSLEITPYEMDLIDRNKQVLQEILGNE